MRLQICHLSDIHFVTGENAILDKKEQLSRAILEYTHKNEDMLFLVSGDIAQSCDNDEYIEAMGFFIYLQEELKKEKNINSYFFFAPGNHDAILNPDDLDEANRRKVVLEKRDTLTKSELEYYQGKMCEKQKNYFDFVSDFMDETVISKLDTKTPLLEQYELKIVDNKIYINVLNTAWISQRKEKPGEIFMPKMVYEKRIVKKDGLNITMYHHPSNWMHPDDKIYFDTEICNHSDIVFVGHEHVGREEHINTSQAEFDIEYGEVLQDLSDKNNSGFKMHFIEDGIISTYTYIWNYGQKIYVSERKPDRKLGENINKAICFLPEYRDKLNSFDMQITHPRKTKPVLNDLYVFPNVEAYNGTIDFEESSKERTIVYGEDLIEYILANKFVEFSGGVKVGKSALGKMIALRLEQIGIHAILINCRNMTSLSIQNIEKLEEHAIYEAYGKQNEKVYRQLLPKRKILIFDNIDYIKSDKFKREVIKHFSNFYDYIVSFTNMSYELATLNETLRKDDDLEIKHCDIQELGRVQRKQLYRNWYELDEGDGIVVDDVEKKIKEATDTINTLKGNGYMPCVASNILIILQQLEFQPERNQDRSNYGHMYEFLIDKSILDMKKVCPSISLDIASGILIWTAQYMLENKCREIDKDIFSQIITAYNDFYYTDASKEVYLREYIRVDLIEEENEQIKFKYPYIHYYFTAKYLANNISKENIQNTISYMASNLQDEECGDIMVFLCHISKEPFIFNCVLENSKNLLADCKVFDFNEYKDIKMDFEEQLDVDFLPEKDIEQRQDEILERQDRYEESKKEKDNRKQELSTQTVEEDSEYIEFQKQTEKLDAAFKSIEVMGQILKNYPGTIDGSVKQALLTETHSLGMRSVTFSYEMIKGIINQFLKKICDKLQEELNKQDNVYDELIVKWREEQTSVLKTQTDNLFGIMCYTIIRRLANALGSEDLKPLINRVKMDDVLSYRLMKWSINLNEFGIIQGILLINFYDELKKSKNHFAAKILKLFVYDHYYIFGSKDIKMRQKVWDRLGFSKKKEKLLLMQTEL